MPIQHMLVPLDFSPYAEQALAYAIDLAQTLRAHLTLLHVIHLTPLAMGDMLAPSLAVYLQAVETEAQQQMHTAHARVQQVGLRCDTLIVQGVPFQTIVDTARDRDVDLIVMGTHGRTGLTHMFIGSVAEKVVRLAPCPVLVTRGSTEATTA
jgi:nucleotide-binding universal stress UspA family protein